VALEERVYVDAAMDDVRIPDAAVITANRSSPLNGANGTAAETHTDNGAGPRTLVATVPVPVPVREWYLELRETGSEKLVTLIEVLSPTNKRLGIGRTQYLEKRQEILGTRTSLVEIDLLRAGEPMPARLRGWPPDQPPGDYRILIARGRQRPRADVYAFSIRDPLPPFPVPLLPDDEEPLVDLQTLVHTLYDRGSFDLRLDYTQDAVPPLTGEDATWADALLREHDLRR
jgi:hypothetical protein